MASTETLGSVTEIIPEAVEVQTPHAVTRVLGIVAAQATAGLKRNPDHNGEITAFGSSC